jgi:small subunit ribosomal protein S7
MARRRVATKRKIQPDPRFNDESIAKFINHIMSCGKKSIAESIVYSALDKLGQRAKGDPLALFKKVLDRLRPPVEVKSRRVGGATYQVPVDVRPIRSLTLAMRWLIGSSRKRAEKGMAARLAAEMYDVLEGRGGSLKQLETVIAMAKANQAFTHFRW